MPQLAACLLSLACVAALTACAAPEPRRGARYTLHFVVDASGDPAPDLRDLDVRLQVRAVVGCL